MLFNSSSTSNVSLPQILDCSNSKASLFIQIAFNVTSIFIVLPLCIFILFLGARQWKKGHSSSSSLTMTHSDCFTYNMAAIELIGVVGNIAFTRGLWREDSITTSVGAIIAAFIWYGQMSFHVLTCVERYLAVVHPVTYLRLRNETGIRIRNVTVSCVWLICVLRTSLVIIVKQTVSTVGSALLISAIIIVFFCSVSILFALIRPGPGEQGGSWECLDQSKKRAFYTILTILGVLLLRFAGNVLWIGLDLYEKGPYCILVSSQLWLNLPSSLVSPLLFLYRKQKLVCCMRKTH